MESITRTTSLGIVILLGLTMGIGAAVSLIARDSQAGASPPTPSAFRPPSQVEEQEQARAQALLDRRAAVQKRHGRSSERAAAPQRVLLDAAGLRGPQTQLMRPLE
jgi:hypothetical protein